MSIVYRGEPRTPKQMAALLLRDKLDELPADWTPETLPDPPSARERGLVADQIEHYKARMHRLLGLPPLS